MRPVHRRRLRSHDARARPVTESYSNSVTPLDHKVIKTAKPAGFEHLLSDYGPQIQDPVASRTIGWGFAILEHLGPERFAALKAHGDTVCLHEANGRWVLVTRWLTPAEAVEAYGPVSATELGPRGGWRSTTYGTTRFVHPKLKPT